MSQELGDFSKKLTEDYEHMDKISIQADMWRSKYLASRLVNELPRWKTNNVVSEQVRHKPGCAVTETGLKLEISDLRRRVSVLSE